MLGDVFERVLSKQGQANKPMRWGSGLRQPEQAPIVEFAPAAGRAEHVQDGWAVGLCIVDPCRFPADLLRLNWGNSSAWLEATLILSRSRTTSRERTTFKPTAKDMSTKSTVTAPLVVSVIAARSIGSSISLWLPYCVQVPWQ